MFSLCDIKKTRLRQSEYKSVNFSVRIKTPTIKLKDDNILEGKAVSFFKKNLNF